MKNYQYSATSAPPASPNPNTTTSTCSSTPPPPHSLASLPPDLFAECLHFLPPAEISRASLQLSKSLRNEGSSERAAWLAIKHMASIAERWTREQNDNLMEVDPEAAEARQLLKDHAMFGPFIGAKGIDTKSTGSKDDGITRFEDESWSILYKLVHDVLIKSPDIDEKVAAIGDNNDRGDDDDTSDNDENNDNAAASKNTNNLNSTDNLNTTEDKNTNAPTTTAIAERHGLFSGSTLVSIFGSVSSRRTSCLFGSDFRLIFADG